MDQFTGSGPWKLTNRYLYGAVVDMILADEQLPNGGIGLGSVSYTSGTTLWPLTDQLGSVRDLVDNNGRIREHVVYSSFGKRLSESDWDAGGNPIASNNPAAVDHLFGYTGREWDDDVELQYNRARWYDPAQGRWLSQDPISFAAGDLNLYRYVGNEATGAADPSGHSPTRNATIPLRELILRIRQTEAGYPSKSPAEHLEIFQNELCHTFMATDFNVAIGLIDKQPGQRVLLWSYIYTEKKEWVDLGHFFTNARAAIRYPKLPAWLLAAAGIAYEEHSRQVGETDPTQPGVGSSAYTPEDLVSNALGVEFGKSLKNNVSLSQQVEEFFTKLGAKEPSEAWNYWYLPPNEDVWEECWRHNPEEAMKWIQIILNRKHDFWAGVSPDSKEAMDHARWGDPWRMILQGPKRKPKTPPQPRR